jgi:tetratricopeptide (TPR) repeat protein
LQGRLEEAAAEGKLASELDPLSPSIPVDRLFAFAWQGKYQAAMEEARKSSNLDPTSFLPYFADGWIDLQEGKVNDAIAEIQKSKAMEAPPFVSAWLGYAYGASGDRTHALAEMEDMKKHSLHGYVPAFNLALVYLGLGERQRALDYLEQAYASDSEWLGWLKEDRIFVPLHSEPRYVALMKKVRLTQ